MSENDFDNLTMEQRLLLVAIGEHEKISAMGDYDARINGYSEDTISDLVAFDLIYENYFGYFLFTVKGREYNENI